MQKRFLLIWLGLLLAVTPALLGATRATPDAVRYGLILDGSFVGWVGSVDGGGPVADVVTEKVGGDWMAKKHIGNVKYEEISMTLGTGMSKGLYDWIKASLDHSAQRKNGAIVAADFNYREVYRVEFQGGLLSELGMPALDAASKDAAKMTIKIAPEYTRRLTTGRGKTVGDAGKGSGPQKQWLPANFRLKIDGLDEATTRVSKIEALVIKQKIVVNPVGEQRSTELEPASLEVPNLVFSLPESAADPVYDWFDSFVIQGRSTDDLERGGTLEYLDPKGSPLFTLTFRHLGLFKLAPDKMEAGADSIRRVKAELYCEEVRFGYAPGATN